MGNIKKAGSGFPNWAISPRIQSMSGIDQQVKEYQRILSGHVQNVQGELAKLISKLHLARLQNSSDFIDQVDRTRKAISSMQDFFGPTNRSQSLATLESAVVSLRERPSDYHLIKQLIDAGPEMLTLAGGPILEDRIKSLVTDEQLKKEINELDAKLREFVEEQSDILTYKTLMEIQKLAELIRQSENRSILETICKTDTLYVTLAGLADTLGGGHGAFSATTRLATLAHKVNKTANKKIHDTLLDYVDGLDLEMSDLRTKLAQKGGMLSLEDPRVQAEAEYSGPDFPA